MARFPGRLALIVAGAVALRLVYALTIAPGTAGAIDDGWWYQQVSRNIADGHGFLVPLGSAFHLVPTAEHGPLYPVVLAGAVKLGITADEALRSLGALFGGITVTLIGLIGRRIAGDTAGLVAAAIAAVSPLLIAADGALTSETLYGALIALTLWCALRLLDRPTWQRAALLGVAIGLAALTRSEALLLVVLAAAGWRSPRRALVVLTPVLCAALVMSPWIIRNWSVFDQPLLTNNEGDLLAASNCGSTYAGVNLGYEDITCVPDATGTEAQKAAFWRRTGLDYARDHAGRLPVVLPVRALRTWGVWKPRQSSQERSRNRSLQTLGVVYDYVLTALAAFGAVALWRRRRAHALILLTPIAMVTIASMATFGNVRFRHAAEIPLVVLGSFGALRLSARATARRPAMSGTG